MTSFRPTRLVSAATAAYGVYALVKPSHLPDALGIRGGERSSYEGLAKTYGVRDLIISSAGIAGGPRLRRLALGARITSDVVDCLLLNQKLSDGGARKKATAVTLAWAALNTSVLVADVKKG